jgi:hypothetical protein
MSAGPRQPFISAKARASWSGRAEVQPPTHNRRSYPLRCFGGTQTILDGTWRPSCRSAQAPI